MPLGTARRGHGAPPTHAAGIKATSKEGVLRLRVPKTEQAQPKAIEVEVEG
jgi:HSP20 family molecular chaperone IbpA